MLKNFFHKLKSSPIGAPETLTPGERQRSVKGSDAAGLAAELLIAPTALMQLTAEEALIVVSYMAPQKSRAAPPSFVKATKATPATWCCCLKAK